MTDEECEISYYTLRMETKKAAEGSEYVLAHNSASGTNIEGNSCLAAISGTLLLHFIELRFARICRRNW